MLLISAFKADETYAASPILEPMRQAGVETIVPVSPNALNSFALDTEPLLIQVPSFVQKTTFDIEAATTSVAIGDLNGDGNLDVVLGNRGIPNQILFHEGSFEEILTEERFESFGPINMVTSTVALGDMNSDGYLDIVVGLYNEQNRVYLNDPNQPGIFTDSNIIPVGTPDENTTSLAIGDLNGDAHYDIVVGNHGMTSTVYFNNGSNSTSSFSSAQAEIISSTTSSLSLGDMDGDGLLDIVIGNHLANNFICYNSKIQPGDVGNCQKFSFVKKTSSIALADLDNNGALDVVEGNNGESSLIHLNPCPEEHSPCAEQQIERLQSLPPLPFSPLFPQTTSLAVADMNHDGQLDIIAGNYQQENILYAITSITPQRLVLEKGLLIRSNETQAGSPDGVLVDLKTPTLAIAVADLDKDGDLDVVYGNDNNLQSQIRFSNGAGNFPITPAWEIPDNEVAGSVAWGDVDQDGHLDLAINRRSVVTVYRNEGNVASEAIAMSPYWNSKHDGGHMAWGDIDNDNDLDLAVAENGFYRVYLNQNGVLETEPIDNCCAVEQDAESARSVAWADINQDGYLDLIGQAMEEGGGATEIFLSRPAQTAADSIQFSSGNLLGKNAHKDIVIADLDSNGQPDIITYDSISNYGIGDDTIYFNPTTILKDQLVFRPRFELNQAQTNTGEDTGGDTEGIDYGDIDGDGDLDLIVGTQTGFNRIYKNPGNGHFSRAQSFPFGQPSNTNSVAVGDVDGDGDLDIFVGEQNTNNLVYLNDGLGNFDNSRTLIFDGSDDTSSIALGDVNNDGTLDIAVGNWQNSGAASIYLNHARSLQNLVNPPFFITVTRPLSTADADFFSAGTILTEAEILVPFGLSGPAGGRASKVEAYFSLNGGGKWHHAGTITDDLTVNATHTFTWTSHITGLFGQADNLVFRVEAYPIVKPIPNGVPGPYLWPYMSATTYPFRVRGALPRILAKHGDSDFSTPFARLYRLPPGKSEGAGLHENSIGEPFVTNEEGYLFAPGIFEPGEQWVATLPIANEIQERTALTLYHTSATPSASGLDMQSISQHGIHTITVSAENPLILFDLDIALQWDARPDSKFVQQLHKDILRASELLFDWSDGQIALGDVHVYGYDPTRWAPIYQPDDDVDDWSQAVDIQIYASNRLRPNADVGGNISEHKSFTLPKPLTFTVAHVPTRTKVNYSPGQVRMGTVWNRYGDLDGVVGEDWPSAFAHELAHYLLRLQDSYMGIDEQGRLVTFNDCPSAMTNPYRTDHYSEFLPVNGREEGDGDCGGPANKDGIQGTLSAFVTGLTDWGIISATYSALNTPVSQSNILSGPTTLPLAVTQIINDFGESNRNEMARLLQNRFVISTPSDKEGEEYRLSNQARVYLFGNRDERAKTYPLIDLGNPQLDQIIVSDIYVNDRLCVYDLSNQQPLFGCKEKVKEGDYEIMMRKPSPDWPPLVVIQPNSQTEPPASLINITATFSTPPTDSSDERGLWAQLYPININFPTSTTSLTTKLQLVSDDNPLQYSGTFTLPKLNRAVSGYVHVWRGRDRNGPSGQDDELVIDFTLGGSPCCHHFGDRTLKVSPDGEVIFYSLAYTETTDALYSLQALSRVPSLPTWATQVGQAYRLTASSQAPPFTSTPTSLLFSYLARDVRAIDESFITLYYAPLAVNESAGNVWQPLDTFVNTELNTASALVEEPGFYALMASFQLPLQSGWNLIGYPAVASQPITQALSSLNGKFSQVYGFEPTSEQPWRLYPVNQPGLHDMETLQELEFGKGYWIHATQPITLYLRNPVETKRRDTIGSNSISQPGLLPPSPPALFYGEVTSTEGSPLTDGLIVTATVVSSNDDLVEENTLLCGRGETSEQEGRIFYSVVVNSDSQQAGCGAFGRKVRIYIDGVPAPQELPWDNRSVSEVDLALPTDDE
ncbi:MAG: VCBS repeat-containing protein [Chloroflexota bacterium]